jgi:hypothetical protein
VKPRKLNDEKRSRIEQVARLKADTPSFKELARETGLTVSYLRKLVSEKVQVIENKCSDSRGTGRA